jgi:ABC-type Mn2+/Zn2+ transport system ATPase subunit
MSIFVKKVNPGGVDHKSGAPTLEMDTVSVAYAGAAVSANKGDGKGRNGANYALKSVSFEVHSGDQIAVVGPNGAGKTTLFNVIVGTLKPSKGKVNIFGHDPHHHICIAYVPQRNQIDWTFPVTVEDVVMMGRVGQIGLFRWPRRSDWQLVRQSLDRVGMAHLSKKQIGELSGGQQQRVFIARAIAQGADLLLLDEPFSGLDVPSHEAILEILDALDDRGVTVMVATHDLNLAADRFNQVMLLNREVIAFGRPPAVLTTDNLLKAYGGQMHRLADDNEGLLLTDTCCDHGEESYESTIG